MVHQLPASLLQSLQHTPGFDEDSFVQIHEQATQVTSVRLNPFKISTPHFTVNHKPIPWCKYGYYLHSRPSFITDPFLHAGTYYVQEASSMFIWHILTYLSISEQAIVADICAAPGGKTTLLSSYVTQGVVVANEVIKSRAKILEENIIKWGSGNVLVTQNDPQHFKNLPNYFDVVLVDAPCSGSGLFRKDNEAITEWSEQHVAHCSLRQQRILDDVYPAVKPDGYLIYSTCSYSEQENENVIQQFLQTHSDWESVQIKIPNNWGIVETTNNQYYGYRFYPYLVEGEGFFVAVLHKKGQGVSTLNKSSFISSSKKEKLRVPQQLFLQLTDDYKWYYHRLQWYVAKPLVYQVFSQVQLALYVVYWGIEAGQEKGTDFIPSPALATSVLANLCTNKVDVTLDEALTYLRKNHFNIQLNKGWWLLTYQHFGLGWIKQIGNRINNYYPTTWRILKQSS